MLKRYIAFSIRAFFVGILAYSLCRSGELSYPKTRKVDHLDTYFGVKVADPYRWLEDDTAAAVAQWVQGQNKVTFDYLDKIPYRKKIKERLEQIYNYPRYSAPMHKSEYYIFSKNDGLQNQSVYYIQKGLSGTPEVLIDPNKFSEDGTVRLASLSFSRDAKYFAYGISKSGSDWREIFVVETATRKQLSDHIRWVKVGGVDWFGDGIFYSGYDAPKDTTKLLSAKNEDQKVYYHRLGTNQSQDELVYADPANPLRFSGISATEDESFLILYVSDPGKGNRGNALQVR
ncbi:MAG: S9 family peptidase, partial [Bacteroidota bacterium]